MPKWAKALVTWILGGVASRSLFLSQPFGTLVVLATLGISYWLWFYKE